MTKPAELSRAELVLGLCERFSCLPSALLAEDAGLLRLLRVHARGHPAGHDGHDGGG